MQTNRLEIRQLHWWYWAATWGLLVAGMAGLEEGFVAAPVLAGVQALHYGVLRRSFTAFAVQVRLAAMLFFAIGIFVPEVLWVAIIGLFARLTVNYCVMARALKLMPWNRDHAFSLAFAGRVIFQRPVNGVLTIPK